MKRDDFKYTVTAEGYMISYKGKNIGGAGIMGKSRSRGKARQEDMQMYRQSAERDINSLLHGLGPIYMEKTITEIDKAQAI